ncbi:ArsR/SmtB family transcription factor [Desulfurivibrio alkaliphilus]|nr:metalloregulator ArsR/SmtB family transcription factor [Desulfurivibrio alkaliphilus]
MKDIADILKGLSEEVRLRLLLLLHRHGELCVCELIGALGLPQSTISRHLAYLKHSGWVTGSRRGAWMHYRLAPNPEPLRREILSALAGEAKNRAEVQQDEVNLALYLQNKTNQERCR